MSNQTQTFNVTLRTAGLLASGLNVRFLDDGLEFHGAAGGITLSFLHGRGTARLRFPLEVIRGWEARFTLQSAGFGGGGGAIQLWAMDGRRIGDVEFTGKGVGLGIVAGQGRFR